MKIPLAFIIGCILSFLFLLMTTVSLFWIPHEVEKLNILERLKGPSYQYFLGTDHFGRDIFSMLMVGGQTSITVAIIAVGVGMIFGITLGFLPIGIFIGLFAMITGRERRILFEEE